MQRNRSRRLARKTKNIAAIRIGSKCRRHQSYQAVHTAPEIDRLRRQMHDPVPATDLSPLAPQRRYHRLCQLWSDIAGHDHPRAAKLDLDAARSNIRTCCRHSAPQPPRPKSSPERKPAHPVLYRHACRPADPQPSATCSRNPAINTIPARDPRNVHTGLGTFRQDLVFLFRQPVPSSPFAGDHFNPAVTLLVPGFKPWL